MVMSMAPAPMSTSSASMGSPVTLTPQASPSPSA
jgi:hypothetical protein